MDRRKLKSYFKNGKNSKITDVSKGENIKFLGFQLAQKKRIVEIGRTKVVRKDPINKSKQIKIKITNTSSDPRGIFKQKATNPTLIASCDRNSILPRLITAKFIEKNGRSYRGRRKPEWTTLEIPEIIEKYNYVVRGYLEYYGPIINYPSNLFFFHYLFTYSCAHTLANKLNCKISDIFKKFGKNISIKYKVKTTKKNKEGTNVNGEVQKLSKLISWEDAGNIMTEEKESPKVDLNRNKKLHLHLKT